MQPVLSRILLLLCTIACPVLGDGWTYVAPAPNIYTLIKEDNNQGFDTDFIYRVVYTGNADGESIIPTVDVTITGTPTIVTTYLSSYSTSSSTVIKSFNTTRSSASTWPTTVGYWYTCIQTGTITMAVGSADGVTMQASIGADPAYSKNEDVLLTHTYVPKGAAYTGSVSALARIPLDATASQSFEFYTTNMYNYYSKSQCSV